MNNCHLKTDNTTLAQAVMKLRRISLPPDIDSDLSIAVIDSNISSVLSETEVPIKESFVFNGVHERTAKGDNLIVSTTSSAKRHQIKYALKRDSLYHILPEYLFHPLDRYADTDGDKEEFLKRHKAQIEIEEEALGYFYPFDREFQHLRTKFQEKLNHEILNNNLFIVDFITDGFKVNKNNTFIMNVYPYIVWLRNNRGVHKLIEVAIKYAFKNSLNSFMTISEEIPNLIDTDTCHTSLDGEINNLFCGPEYYHLEERIYVEYQTPITSEKVITDLADAITEFTDFFKSWFLSQNQSLKVRLGDYKKRPIMDVGTTDNDLYLGYNTQLI